MKLKQLKRIIVDILVYTIKFSFSKTLKIVMCYGDKRN